MEGPHPGLTEWEIFNQPQPDVHVFKILVNGEFAYHWDVYPGETVEVGLYSYPEDEPVTWKLNGTAISLEQLNRRISEESGTAVIQVISLKTGDILDEIYIYIKHLVLINFMPVLHIPIIVCACGWISRKSNVGIIS